VNIPEMVSKWSRGEAIFVFTPNDRAHAGKEMPLNRGHFQITPVAPTQRKKSQQPANIARATNIP
jgi:hypothetical protein